MFDLFFQAKDRFDDYMKRHLLPYVPQTVTPNWVTGIRFGLSAGVILAVFFFFLASPWIVVVALLLLGGAIATDWMDGWLARNRGPMTNWGKRWDERADKLLVLGTVAAILWHWQRGEVTEWTWMTLAVLLSLTTSRDVLMVYLRKRGLTETSVLPVAKLKTAVQMMSLAPLILAEWWLSLADVGVLLFAGATALSWYSGWVYSRPARRQLTDVYAKVMGQ